MDAQHFVAEMIARDVLLFGDFTLKSGRQSPYFFNLGAIDDGPGLALLGQAYADGLAAFDFEFDVVFGPAYKGIPIAVAAAATLATHHNRQVGFAYNRKEAKEHGEGGVLVGAALKGKSCVLVDDVLTAGTAIREASAIVEVAGGRIAGVLVALDREEKQPDGLTALGAVSAELAVPCAAIATLQDVIRYLDSTTGSEKDHSLALERIVRHRNPT